MMIAVLGITMTPGVSQAAGVVYDPAAIISATTDDNVTIKIYHYRPATSEPFRKGSPVLLFPGILQNSSQYLSSTPPENSADYSKTTLPDPLPDWAIAKDANGDPLYYGNGEPVLEKYINADHMKIWSLAHYLWIKGYDVWLANYRDTGRGAMRSSGTYKETLTTLDTWGALDAAAAIAKVQQLTGKKIYIGGHSTGSFAAYIYLQGCYIDYFGWSNKNLAYRTANGLGYQPHVKNSTALAVQRNAAIKGWIALDPAGVPVSVDIAPRRAGNRMIEEFMLLANQLVAERYAKKDAPFVYRVHGAPAPDKVRELAFFFKSFHLKLKESGGQTTPMAIQELLRQTEGQPFERVVNTVTLRSMQKAVYDPKCTGHFGLALDYYCHFTSPIRRYPDLMIHRIIREDLRQGLAGSRIRALRKLVREGAEAATAREQEAVELEREAEKMKKAEYMTYHIGEILPGIISGVGNFGIFVELENTVEGLVPMSALTGDYYEFQAEAHRLKGIRTHRTYTLGDRVTIRVEAADPADRTVTFSLG